MTARTTIRVAALGTFAFVCAVIFVRDVPGMKDIVLGPVETVSGVPFPETPEGIRITEPLAHVRVPFSRTSVGKRLDLEFTVSARDADVIEVGVRRGSFWLDYERMPVRHRVLDRLSTSGSEWIVRRNGMETVFFPPNAPVAASSVETFLASPPSTGTIGLYGNATLPCAVEKTCTVAPFRVTDDPSAFSVIYAQYVPQQEDEMTKRVSIPLTGMFQNPDGSFDVMFFLQSKDEDQTSITLKNIRVNIRPAWPSIGELKSRTLRLWTDFRTYLKGAEQP